MLVEQVNTHAHAILGVCGLHTLWENNVFVIFLKSKQERIKNDGFMKMLVTHVEQVKTYFLAYVVIWNWYFFALAVSLTKLCIHIENFE